MPNFCQNVLTISHADSQITGELEESIKVGRLLRFIAPLPNPVENEFLTQDEYHWRINHWGLNGISQVL